MSPTTSESVSARPQKKFPAAQPQNLERSSKSHPPHFEHAFAAPHHRHGKAHEAQRSAKHTASKHRKMSCLNASTSKFTKAPRAVAESLIAVGAQDDEKTLRNEKDRVCRGPTDRMAAL